MTAMTKYNVITNLTQSGDGHATELSYQCIAMQP